MAKAKLKTEIVTLRMEPWMKMMLKKNAEKAHMTLTEYLCLCGLGKEIVQVEGLSEVLSELKAQGRNLNQLTTLANMGRIQFVRGDELVDAYAKLQQQLAEITKAVNGAPAKAVPSFCGERRHPGMDELSAHRPEANDMEEVSTKWQSSPQ